MFKVTILLKRAPLSDHAAFSSASNSTAAETIKRLAASPGALRFAQSHLHSAASPFSGMDESAFDGAEAYWFESEQAARAYFSLGFSLEKSFYGWADYSASVEISGNVHAVSDVPPAEGPETLKIMAGGVRKDGMSFDDYRHHMNHVHGPLAMANPDTSRPKPRVEYCHAAGVSISGLPAGNYDSVGDIWMSGTLQALMGLLNDQYYREVLGPDEANFTSKEKSFSMITVEHNIWGKIACR